MLAWQAWLARLLDLLAPAGCLACDAECQPPELFCAACGKPARAEQPLTLDGTALCLVGPYRPPLSAAIVRLKYQSRPDLSRALGALLAPALRALALPPGTLLAPVPMHPRRLAQRGYNQATLLAQALARSSQGQLVCEPRLLRRTREAERQVGKSRRERVSSARDAFELTSKRSHGGARVVLVDDVITTGSTVRACAQALAAGGAELAAIVALARTEHS